MHTMRSRSCSRSTGASPSAARTTSWRRGGGIVVRADAEHPLDCNGALGVMVFVDPESREGAWLSASLRQDITTVPDTRLISMPQLRTFAEQPDETQDVAALVRGCVQSLRPGLAPTRRFDSRVTTVLNAIRESDDLRMSLDKAADMACLSPTRFAHLFRDQVGLPFSRYMLWRKLTRAMVAIASERTIAAAAHAADFADAAHLTRTFYQMVGMAPSALMRGDFTEIASPFDSVPQGSEERRAAADQIADSFNDNSRFIQSHCRPKCELPFVVDTMSTRNRSF